MLAYWEVLPRQQATCAEVWFSNMLRSHGRVATPTQIWADAGRLVNPQTVVLCIFGVHLIKYWVWTLANITQITAESEAIIIVKGASGAIGIRRLGHDLGRKRRITFHAGASAALAIADKSLTWEGNTCGYGDDVDTSEAVQGGAESHKNVRHQ